MDFTNLDEVATWMLNNIRLSRYDDQFVNNLTLYITQYGRITSNQHALFKKVASKYVRQFNHHKLNVNDILNLPWSVAIIESTPEYTGASISIEGDEIILRAPYSKNFITAYRKNPVYSMMWDKEKRLYNMVYSPTSLRDLMYMVAEHYEIINFCPIVRSIIDKLGEYETVKYWVPTLTYSDGYYCIKAINTHLHEAIKDISINDDLKTLAMLAKHGVKIDDSVINHFNETNDPNKVKFAAQFHLDFELREMDTAIDWLTELGCDGIIEPKVFLKDKLNTTIAPKDLSKCDNPVIIYYRGGLAMIEDKPANLLKIIKCVNSEPIDLGPK